MFLPPSYAETPQVWGQQLLSLRVLAPGSAPAERGLGCKEHVAAEVKLPAQLLRGPAAGEGAGCLGGVPGQGQPPRPAVSLQSEQHLPGGGEVPLLTHSAPSEARPVGPAAPSSRWKAQERSSAPAPNLFHPGLLSSGCVTVAGELCPAQGTHGRCQLLLPLFQAQVLIALKAFDFQLGCGAERRPRG